MGVIRVRFSIMRTLIITFFIFALAACAEPDPIIRIVVVTSLVEKPVEVTKIFPGNG